MSQIKIVLADDHGIMRDGLRLLLASQSDLDVVDEASDGVEALELCCRVQPEVVVIDIAMPRMNGIDTIKLLRQRCPETRAVILSGYEKEAYIHEALEAGAHAYIIKGAPSRELLAAIRAAARGKTFLGETVQKTVIDRYLQQHEKRPAPTEFDQLSEREKQVFMLLVQGNSAAQIADILCISSKTVDKHRAAVSQKLGTENPVKMLQFAIRTGLIDPKFWES